MKTIETRLAAVEARSPADDTFGGLLSRMHARGLHVPRIIVHADEDADEVRQRAGIPAAMPLIVRQIVQKAVRAANGKPASHLEPALAGVANTKSTSHLEPPDAVAG